MQIIFLHTSSERKFMKKHLTILLIITLLIQLEGCYSMSEMSLEELKNYYGPDEIKIRTNQMEVIIYRKSSGSRYMNWEPTDSSIIIETKELIKLDNTNAVNTQTNQIKYSDINSAEIGEIDGLKTALLTVGVIVVVGLIIGLSTVSMGIFH